MKYSNFLGFAAAILLIISSFLPWTYHPDLEKTFTGFFSQDNIYGKPGKVFIFFSTIAIIFFLIPRVWAKRWNLLVAALTVAYAIKSFILFSGCYRGTCPIIRAGLWLMLGSAIVMMIMALIPRDPLPPKG